MGTRHGGRVDHSNVWSPRHGWRTAQLHGAATIFAVEVVGDEHSSGARKDEDGKSGYYYGGGEPDSAEEERPGRRRGEPSLPISAVDVADVDDALQSGFYY